MEQAVNENALSRAQSLAPGTAHMCIHVYVHEHECVCVCVVCAALYWVLMYLACGRAQEPGEKVHE